MKPNPDRIPDSRKAGCWWRLKKIHTFSGRQAASRRRSAHRNPHHWRPAIDNPFADEHPRRRTLLRTSISLITEQRSKNSRRRRHGNTEKLTRESRELEMADLIYSTSERFSTFQSRATQPETAEPLGGKAPTYRNDLLWKTDSNVHLSAGGFYLEKKIGVRSERMKSRTRERREKRKRHDKIV